MKPDTSAYLKSWSLELLSRADRVRQLIGDAHWLSDGHHKEELLREFLARYLPRDLIISRGFVTAADVAGRCSPEVDVLISDLCLNPPLFCEGGLQIVDPSSVLAHIEVKTTFSRAKLEDALAASTRTSAVIGIKRDTSLVWSGVQFLTGAGDAESVLNTIEAAIRETARRNSEEGGIQVCVWPSAITIVDSGVVFLTARDARTVDCRLFQIGTLSLPCCLADLFGHVRRIRGGVPLGGLDDVVEGIGVAPPVLRRIEL